MQDAVVALALAALAVGAALGQTASTDYFPWSGARGQFLNREYYPWWDERYENYSLLSYRDYGAAAAQRENATYDPFGEYLLDGVELLRLSEYRTLAPRRGSQVFRSAQLQSAFRNLVVMRDQYQSWSNRLMVGDALEARFTSLTLNEPRLQGLRWDASSHKNRFSVVGARVSSPVVIGSTANDLEFATWLTGGHWESQLGDVLTLGASYVNLYLRDSMQRNGSLRGDFPAALGATRSYFVIVSDDSPEDREPAQVYGLQVLVNGVPIEVQPEVRRVEDVVQPTHVAHLRRNGAWGPQCMDAARLLAPTTGLYYTRGVPVSQSLPYTVGGTDLLVFRVQIPANDVERLEFRVRVAGDYSIDVGASFPWQAVADRTWEDWHNVARAAGNVADGSNLRWVRFEYAFLTGIMQYGSNASLRLLGATVDGEFVDNLANRSFPHTDGHRTQSTRAGFVRAARPFGPVRLGGEWFDVPADLLTRLRMWSPNAGKVIDYELVRDNDDGDVWPDSWEHWDPLDPLYVSLKSQTGMDPEAQPTQEAKDNLSSGLANSVGFGVYPGLDLDEDTVLDINLTQNGTPDWAEPFLMYGVEPEDFVYGDDLNNNGVVDARENDNRPDYPYPLDSRGYHLFGTVTAPGGTQLRGGRYRVEQPAGNGRNWVDYVEAKYTRAGSARASLEADWRLRRVRDDIPDPVYRVVIDPLSSTSSSVKILHDPLLMQDSWVNTAFVEGRCRPVGGLRMTSAGKVELNAAAPAAAGGDRRRIGEVYWVGKTDYSWRRGRAKLMPMAKVQYHRRVAPASLLLDRHTVELFPILRLDYALGERTMLHGGVQGLPGWPHRYRDIESGTSDFDARHYILAIQNTTNYTGYELSLSMGFSSSRTEYVGLPSRRVHRAKEFFVQARVL